MLRRSIALTVCLGLACEGAPDAPSVRVGAQWREGDEVFRAEPRWMGGDGAYSVALGGDRVLWLFGDSFVSNADGATRAQARLVRNSVALQVGLDPSRTRADFAWGRNADGSPRSFFTHPTEAERDFWYWPAGGARIASGAVVVFLSRVRPTPGQGLGFANAGWRVARVLDTDRDTDAWRFEWLDPPPAQRFDAVVGAAVARSGGWVYALAPTDVGRHDAFLARFDEGALARGELRPFWWTRGGWALHENLPGEPDVVIREAGSESSLHYDPRLARWVHVTSRGFGASTIAMRFAARPEGPWSDAYDVFTPPESRGPSPFVYAAKAHPELTTGDASELVVTYATNSFDFDTLLAPEGASLYWPRFVRVRLAP